MANLAQIVRLDSVLKLRSAQPVCFACVATVLLFGISLSVDATEVAIATLGALTYALFFKLFPVQQPPAKRKSVSAIGAYGDQSTDGNGVSAFKPKVAGSLRPTSFKKPPPGLELPHTSTKIVETVVDPQTPEPAGTADFARAAHEPCGLQRAKQGGPRAELEWGLHLRDTLNALSRTPTKPKERNSVSDQQKNVTTNQQGQALSCQRFGHLIRDENSLRSNLQKLAKVDPERVLMVKKIAKLGLGSDLVLRAHFKQLGTVEQVLVSHSIDKCCSDRDRPRVRAGNTGFVVMSTAEDVSSVLAHGSVQVIERVNVGVSKYVSRHAVLDLDTQ